MDEELRKQIFASARDSYDRTLKWTTLALILAAMFHLIVYTRYIELAKGRHSAAGEQARLHNVSEVMTDVGSVVKELQELLSTTGHAVLDHDLAALRSDFVSFSRAIDAVRRGKDPSAPAEPTSREREAPDPLNLDNVPNAAFRENPVAQQPLDVRQFPNMPNIAALPNSPGISFDPDAAALRRWKFEPELAARLRTARNDDLLQIIKPIVQEQIIQPRFDSLRKAWNTRVAIPAAEKAARINELITTHQSELDSAAPGFKQIQESVRDASERTKNARLEPPGNEWWWETVGGKMMVYGGIREDADNQVRSALASSDISGLEVSIKRALDAKQKEVAKIEKQLTDLEESMKEQSKVLGAVSEPFKFLAADMSYLIMKFPLLLGVLWGVSAWQRGAGLSRLAMLGATGDPGSAGQALSVLLGKWPEPISSVVGRALLGCAWVALAAWQYRELPEVGSSAATFGAIGATCAIVGEGLRFRLLRGVVGAVVAPR